MTEIIEETFLAFFRPLRRRQWHPTPVLLPGKSRERQSLVGCSPRGREKSNTAEWLHFHFSLSCVGEGNGNPPQYSCLENPRDGEAWWAAINEAAQSRTWLKWLSCRSSSTRFLKIVLNYIFKTLWIFCQRHALNNKNFDQGIYVIRENIFTLLKLNFYP